MSDEKKQDQVIDPSGIFRLSGGIAGNIAEVLLEASARGERPSPMTYPRWSFTGLVWVLGRLVEFLWAERTLTNLLVEKAREEERDENRVRAKRAEERISFLETQIRTATATICGAVGGDPVITDAAERVVDRIEIERANTARARDEERARVEKLYEIPMKTLTAAVSDLSTRGRRLGVVHGTQPIDEWVKAHLDEVEARQGGPSAEHLWQRVQELEGAVRAACEVWERVPSASLHETRTTMRLLRKAIDAPAPDSNVIILHVQDTHGMTKEEIVRWFEERMPKGDGSR